MNDPTLPNLARPDDDPWLWLEEVEGERALAWVEERNAETLALLAGLYEEDAERLRAALDRPGKLPHPGRRGRWLYNFWRDERNPRGLWRRATLDGYRRDEWETVLDLDALADAEGEDWVWGGATTRPGAHDRALLRLSRGGSDAAVLREFDVEARAFVAGYGFDLPEQKGGAAWLDRDALILSSSLGGETRSGYARTVRLWRRGEDPREAATVFKVPEDSMSCWADADPDEPGRVWFAEKTGFYTSRVWIGDATGPKRLVELPEDAEYVWHRGFLAVRTRSASLGHAADTLLGIGLDAFLEGSRDFRVLRRPAPRRSLQGFFWAGGRLVVSELDELRPVHTVFGPREGWREAELPGAPRAGVASVWPLDVEAEEGDGALLMQVEDPATPPRLLLTSTDLAAPEVLRESTPAFAADGLLVQQREAVSADGERVPYFQIGPRGEPTGDAPVYLYGYGGFRIPILPNYATNSGVTWLAKGGTVVLACVRGGGEFGTWWHEAGVRERKRLAHEDFASVAADLVARGVTRPKRIAAAGGSNGGLLIGNMLTRHPEKFGALFCTIPLLDMRRYTKLLAGASWIAEYGDPDAPEDWAFLSEISAYHRAERGRRYPPILLATTRRDDRVHPGHARKMAAKLRALGYDAHFFEPAAGGHGLGKDNAEAARSAAVGMAFLRRAIGFGRERDVIESELT